MLLTQKWKGFLKRSKKAKSIQMTISISFTVVSMVITCFLGVILYRRFVNRTKEMTMENTTQVLNQTAINFEEYLRNMRQISDAMYYSVIKDKDLAVDSLDEEMNLFYEANKDKLISIACYTYGGDLVAASPVANQKQDVDVNAQKWFSDAVGQMENLHFSTPHVQNLFDDTSFRYYWVISLSRMVELTDNGNSEIGVLLVDMNYRNIEQLLDKVNRDNSLEYVYLMDSNGELLYHPKQDLIASGLFAENNRTAADYSDGSIEEIYNGEERLITVKTISYTGWKIISVVPIKAFDTGLIGTRYFVVLLVALALFAAMILNHMVSARIAKPLKKLNNSIKEWEAGNMDPEIYIGGSLEVEHLGKTLRATVGQIRQLMQDILVEQEEKRKSELDALQAQINPHFLYNTLDSIVWMIEGGRNQEAVFMITQLASLFRISLSKGKTVISIGDELKHAQNYMNIQKVRFRNSFEVIFDIDPEIEKCRTVKLVVQPLLENAIYYGVGCTEDEGVIEVRGYRNDQGICIDVMDNGLGMTEEEVSHLLTEQNRVHSHGSGVGLLNVHNRIKLYFGEQYGLEIISRPDEGTIARIHLPDQPYESGGNR